MTSRKGIKVVKNAKNLRLVYDIAILVSTVILTIVLSGLYRPLTINDGLLVVALGLMVFFSLKALGIYSTRKKSSFRIKAALIGLAYVISSAIVSIILSDPRLAFFFTAFGFPLQLVPRFISNC